MKKMQTASQLNQRFIKKIQGIALFTVLVITSIITSLLADMSYQKYFVIDSYDNVRKQDYLLMNLIGAEDLIKQFLLYEKTINQFDHKDEKWLKEKIQFPFEDLGDLEIEIKDLQGKVNLNNFKYIETKSLEYKMLSSGFAFLLEQYSINNGKKHLSVIIDWIDEDDSTHKDGGAESSKYSYKDIPYSTPNNIISSKHELYLMDGFDEKVIGGLGQNNLLIADYIMHFSSYIPELTKVNINTADCHFLTGMIEEKYQEAIAKSCVGEGTPYYEDVKSFYTAIDKNGPQEKDANGNIVPILWNELLKEELFTVESRYFEITITMKAEQGNMKLISLIKRKDNENVYTLQRKFVRIE